MTINELVESGICEDMEEALTMFPIEVFEDFEPGDGESPGLGTTPLPAGFVPVPSWN